MPSPKQYIDLQMPSIMGMGAVGPTLAVLTATLYSALCSMMEVPPHWAYAAIMLVLSGLLATFPTAKMTYPLWQKVALWPIATAIVFSMAWGTNNGMSVGEDALNGDSPVVEEVSSWSFSLVPSAYAGNGDTKLTLPEKPILNKVDFSHVMFDSKKAVSQEPFKKIPKDTWGLSWKGVLTVYLKDDKGVWWQYQLRPPEPKPEPIQSQRPLKGGFFKRY